MLFMFMLCRRLAGCGVTRQRQDIARPLPPFNPFIRYLPAYSCNPKSVFPGVIRFSRLWTNVAMREGLSGRPMMALRHETGICPSSRGMTFSSMKHNPSTQIRARISHASNEHIIPAPISLSALPAQTPASFRGLTLKPKFFPLRSAFSLSHALRSFSTFGALRSSFSVTIPTFHPYRSLRF
jgi:hypothetical protein